MPLIGPVKVAPFLSAPAFVFLILAAYIPFPVLESFLPIGVQVSGKQYDRLWNYIAIGYVADH